MTKRKVYFHTMFRVIDSVRCFGEVLMSLPFSKARGINAMKAVEEHFVEGLA